MITADGVDVINPFLRGAPEVTTTFAVVMTPDALCAAVHAGLNSEDPVSVECLTKAIRLQVPRLPEGHLYFLRNALLGHLTARHGWRNTSSDQAWLEAYEAVSARLGSEVAA